MLLYNIVSTFKHVYLHAYSAYLYCFVVLCRIEAQSKTLPSGSPKLTTAKAAAEDKEKKKTSKHSSADGDSSPKHSSGLAKLFRRRDKGRSHSIQEFDLKQREEKKSGKKGAKISFPMRSKDTVRF